jgi:hypothetical protein
MRLDGTTNPGGSAVNSFVILMLSMAVMLASTFELGSMEGQFSSPFDC